MDRGRDRRYEGRGEGQVTKMGGGESYRPIARPRSPDAARYGRDRDRSPLRRDRVRSPPRERDRTPPDTYRSNARDRSPRRRSRSRSPPPYRGRDRTPPREIQTWRSREKARSPLRARSPMRGRASPRARTPQRARTSPRLRTPPKARLSPRPRSPLRPRSPFRPRSPVGVRTSTGAISLVRARSPLRNRSPVWARSPVRARSPPPPRPRSPRARTPPRRYSPRRDDDRRERDRPRSSRKEDFDMRDSRRRSMSPYETRLPTRARSPFPARRSPPTGPRGDWRQRSRSPRRDSRVISGPTSLTWRRRSPSPVVGADHSARTSGNNSRRSSPPVHPGRAALTQPSSRDEPHSLDSQSPHERSPFSYRERMTPRERSPARPNLSREERRSPAARSPPRGPSALRTQTGSSATRNFTAPARSPPPNSSTGPVTAATATRADNPTLFPPSGPRGYSVPSRGTARGGRVGSFSDRRPDSGPPRGAGPPVVRAAPNASPTVPVVSPTSSSIPTGPRVSSSQPWPSRPSPTIPRGSRFDQLTSQSRLHPALANLPQIIPGGKKDPSYTSCIPKDLEMRIKKTEEETERLREELRVKEEKLRKSLKTWDKLERDSKAMGLRSELSERHVRVLAGEGVGGAAF